MVLATSQQEFSDADFRIVDNGDQSKKLAFEVSGIAAATTRKWTVPDANGTVVLTDAGVASLSGHLYGLTLSNNGSDATNDIDIATGNAIDSANAAFMTLAASITKRLDAAWAVGTNQGGLDTGSIADTTYHVFLIKRPDTGVVDALFSTSASAPTMPTNYTLFRRVGSIVRTGGAVKAFTQRGDEFRWSAVASDVAATNPGTSAVTRTLTVPTGIVVDALMRVSVQNAGAANYASYLVTALTDTDVVPDSVNTHGMALNAAGWAYIRDADISVKTNTSAQVRTRVGNNSDANVTVYIFTYGWVDNRGRL